MATRASANRVGDTGEGLMAGVKQEDQDRIAMALAFTIMVMGIVFFVLSIGIILGRFL